MKSSITDSPKLVSGVHGFFRLGTRKNTNQTTDFTGAGASQVFVLTVLQPGDRVLTHGIVADLITPLVSSTGATVTGKLGIVGDDNRFIAGSADNLRATVAKTLLPDAAALGDLLPYVNNTANPINLVFTITMGSGAVSDITAGEIQLQIPIGRFDDRVRFMDA